MNSYYEQLEILLGRIRFITDEIITNIFVITGILFNVVALCIWVLGPKSKSVCCSVYFAANAVADILLLTVRDYFYWHTYIRSTAFTCKMTAFLYRASFQLSTWISAIITVERSITILWPFVFKSQTMRRRSLFVILVIVLLQLITQYNALYFTENDVSTCIYTDYQIYKYKFDRLFGYMVLTLMVPFFLIVVFNAATVFTLCRNLMRRNTVSGTRDHVNVFTKLTLLTGVSFVVAFTLTVYQGLIDYRNLDLNDDWMKSIIILFIIKDVSNCMKHFNSFMNPIICFIVCKSTRDDIKHFMKVVAQKVLRPCRRTQREASRTNVNPENIELEQVVPVNAGTTLNVQSTPV